MMLELQKDANKLQEEIREGRKAEKAAAKAAKALEREKAKQVEGEAPPSKRHRPTVALPQEIAPLLERCYHDEFVQEPERTEI